MPWQIFPINMVVEVADIVLDLDNISESTAIIVHNVDINVYWLCSQMYV